MPNQPKQTNEEDLGIKLGSDDMVFWRNLCEARKIDIKVATENMKYFEFILKNAEEEYKKAEEEFNK